MSNPWCLDWLCLAVCAATLGCTIPMHPKDLATGHGSDRPAEFDVLVVYEDRWQWDMSNYLIFLWIDLRDPETNVLLVTGSYYQSSMARRSVSTVVSEILAAMFAEP